MKTHKYILAFAFLFILHGCTGTCRSADLNNNNPNPVELPDSLTIVTYNVLADEELAGIRLKPLLKLLELANADIIVMQECLPFMVSALKNESWTSSYKFLPDNGATFQTGAFCIMSKFPVEDSYFEMLPGNLQERGTLIVHLKVGKSKLAVATVHLESNLESGPTRAVQLKRVFSLLDNSTEAILAGDFNFGDGEEPESSALKKEYVDCWKTLRPDDPGYTWDIEKSEWAKKESFPGEPSRRLDRVIIKTELWAPSEAQIIGTERIKAGVFPSDHFGLRVILKRKLK
jgi:endonuclease/exonuclease/phosphatase family metal-dependent hydrolase